MAWTERKPMCACADVDSAWIGHGLTARYVCTCGGATVSTRGLCWAPQWVPAESDDDDDGEVV